jgi:hypothetical protein
MNENFNGKINTLKSAFDDLSNIFTEQIEGVKDELKTSNEVYKKDYETALTSNLQDEKIQYQTFSKDYTNFKM